MLWPHVSFVLSRVGLSASLWTLSDPPLAAPPRVAPPGEVLSLSGDAPSATERWVFVDYDALTQAQERGGEWLRYDLDRVTRPVDAATLLDEPELSVAVRLVVSEVGADRLIESRFGLLEALAVLYTVSNRRDPAWQNPLNLVEAPQFPGCDAGGTFATCANADQYLGMATWRALDPSSRYPAEMLAPAVDIAVAAWWIHSLRAVEDPTNGATYYVHRCGGAAYGMKTFHCDGHLGFPRLDVPGANPHTGPIVFRSLGPWIPRKGRYEAVESTALDYVGVGQETPDGALRTSSELGGLGFVTVSAAVMTDVR